MQIADNNLSCPLCGDESLFFREFRGKDYYRCGGCFSLFLSPEHQLTPEAEKSRYEEHNNDVNDLKYQDFVSPMVGEIIRKFTPEDKGLDFGCGSGPVITKLLRDKNYNIAMYDPFFFNDKKALDSKYDYIACCEVIEHFSNPLKEFRLLRKLLKEGGNLYCMTEHYGPEVDFQDWYYKNDATHVFFYHRKSYQWIKENCGFSNYAIRGRLVKFS